MKYNEKADMIRLARFNQYWFLNNEIMKEIANALDLLHKIESGEYRLTDENGQDISVEEAMK